MSSELIERWEVNLPSIREEKQGIDGKKVLFDRESTVRHDRTTADLAVDIDCIGQSLENSTL